MPATSCEPRWRCCARSWSAPAASIRIDLIDPDAMELWRTVVKIAEVFGRDRRWCLVGGLIPIKRIGID